MHTCVHFQMMHTPGCAFSSSNTFTDLLVYANGPQAMGMLGGGRTIDSVWHHYEKVGGAHKTALTRSENFATNHAGMRCVNPQPKLLHVCVPVKCHQCTPCSPQQADSSCIALYLSFRRSRVNVECASIWYIAASDYAMSLVDVACGKTQHTHTHTCSFACRGLLAGQDSPVAAVVASVYGKPVTLYKEKINYKLPGGGGYRAHQVCADSIVHGS